jgi:hypothetical protein
MAIQTLNDFKEAVTHELESLMFVKAISRYSCVRAIREVQDFNAVDMDCMGVSEAADLALGAIGVNV